MSTLFLVALLCLTTLASGEELVYVWGGSDKGDFMAVVDYTPDSPNYGAVIHKTTLPDTATVKSSGNEPHHMAIAGDNEYLVAGGLMSFAQGSAEIFVFELDPETKFPVFKYGLNVPGGCVDEFIPLPWSNTEFIVTMMCSETGGAPGTLVWIDVETGEFKEWIDRSKVTDFNPHGGAYDETAGLVVTDYVFPLSLFTDKFLFRDTLHHFNPDGSLASVITMPTTNGGFMDFKWLTKNQQGITGSLQENLLYLIEPLRTDGPKYTAIYDLTEVNGGAPALSAGIMTTFKRGDRLLMSYALRYVVLFKYDPSNPKKLEKLQHFDFCDKKNGLEAVHKVCDRTGNMPGTHWISIGPEEDRFLVANYFVTVGNAQLAGSKTIHSFSMSADANSFELDEDFRPYLTLEGATDRPHLVLQITWPDSDTPSSSTSVLPTLVACLMFAFSILF